MSVRLGVGLPQFSGEPRDLVAGAQRAEALGLDSVWVFDHLWPLGGDRYRPILEAWTSVAHVAEATKSITVGTLVSRSTLRLPAVLARMASTVAAVAPGRLVVGVGSGDAASRPENDAFGLPYPAGAARQRQLEATVEALRASTAAPLWLGGRSRAVVRMAARLGDGWNAWGMEVRRFASCVSLLRAEAEGRPVEATWGCQALLARSGSDARAKLGGRNPDAYVVGDPDGVAGRLRDIAAAGASHLVVAFPDAASVGPYELLATEVRDRLDQIPQGGILRP